MTLYLRAGIFQLEEYLLWGCSEGVKKVAQNIFLTLKEAFDDRMLNDLDKDNHNNL